MRGNPTNRGMMTFGNDGQAEKIHQDLGADVSGRDFLPFSDLEKSVRDDVGTIRASDLIPDDVVVAGAVYDVASVELREIVVSYRTRSVPRWGRLILPVGEGAPGGFLLRYGLRRRARRDVFLFGVLFGVLGVLMPLLVLHGVRVPLGHGFPLCLAHFCVRVAPLYHRAEGHPVKARA